MIYILSLQLALVAALVSLFILMRCLSGQGVNKSRQIISVVGRIIISIGLMGLCAWRMIELARHAVKFSEIDKASIFICFLILFLICDRVEYAIKIGKETSRTKPYSVIKNKRVYLTAAWIIHTGILLQFVSIGMGYIMVRETPYSTKYAGMTAHSIIVLIVGMGLAIIGSLIAALIGSDRIQIKSDDILVTVHKLMEYKHYSIADIETMRMETRGERKILVVQWKDLRQDRLDFWETEEDTVFLSMLRTATEKEKPQISVNEKIGRFKFVNRQFYRGILVQDGAWQLLISRFYWVIFITIAFVFVM